MTKKRKVLVCLTCVGAMISLYAETSCFVGGDAPPQPVTYSSSSESVALMTARFQGVQTASLDCRTRTVDFSDPSGFNSLRPGLILVLQ